VELLRPKMRLDLGGIAKGYAVDRPSRQYESRDHAGDVEAGGNIVSAIRRRISPAAASASRLSPRAPRDSIFAFRAWRFPPRAICGSTPSSAACAIRT